MLIRFTIISLLFVFVGNANSQSIQLDQRADEGVIHFLDELNNQRFLDESFLTLPLVRSEVAAMLDSIDVSQLNARQKKELQFYQLAFTKDLDAEHRPETAKKFQNPFKVLDRYKQFDVLYLKKGETAITVNSIVGAKYYNNKNGLNWQRRVGADFQAYFGKISLYGSVRDVYELKPMATDSLLMQHEGALYKYNPDGSAEFSETRGGITYGWKDGYIGLVRDYVQWGYGYYGTNIFDINTAPFAQLKLHLSPTPWFKFDYFHGSLQSQVIDSSSIANVGGVATFDFINKYIAANMFSFRPWKPLWLSFGNSMIYSSQTPEAIYLVPILFYKSADHYLGARGNRAGGSGNAQMFSAFSFRPLEKLHLYSTLYVDEISFRNMRDKERHSNWFSLKAGGRVSNILPNVTITAEYTRNNPMAYKHFLKTTDFTNAGYNMGHYLRDNSQEAVIAIDYKPLYWLSMQAMYRFAEKGVDIKDDRVTKDPVTGILLVQGIDFLANTKWIQSTYSFQVSAQPIYRLRFTARIDKIQRPEENNAYQAPYLRGNNTTVSIGLNYGF